MQRRLNLHYASVHGTYWMFFGICNSFASIFLLARGFTNSQIGLVLAAGNIFAILLQPFLGDLADRSKRITIFHIMEGGALILACLMGFLLVDKRGGLGLAIVYILSIGWLRILEPFGNALSGKLEEKGVLINFGACRSIGSLCYAILMSVTGVMVEKWGTGILPISGIVVLALLFIAVATTQIAFNSNPNLGRKAKNEVLPKFCEGEAELDIGVDAIEAKEIDLKQFISRHKMFMVMCIGTMFLFYGNNTVNNYMAQIAGSVGGDSADVGRIFSLLAFLEIPTMVLFNRLHKRFSCAGMIKFSAVAFVLWIGTCMIAKNVGTIFLAQFFQPFAFALFLPAVVRFITDIMEKGEAVKGQTMHTTVTTTGAIFASLLGGVILDAGGAKALTLVGTIVTIIGAAIIIIFVNKAEREGVTYGTK